MGMPFRDIWGLCKGRIQKCSNNASDFFLDPLGVVLSKRSRQEEDGVLEEGSERCRKRVAFSDNLTVEAAGQPRRQP